MKKILGIIVIALFLTTALTVNAQIAPAAAGIEVFEDLNVQLMGVLADTTAAALQVRILVGGAFNVLLTDIDPLLLDAVVTCIALGTGCILDCTVTFDTWGNIVTIVTDRLVIGIDPAP